MRLPPALRRLLVALTPLALLGGGLLLLRPSPERFEDAAYGYSLRAPAAWVVAERREFAGLGEVRRAWRSGERAVAAVLTRPARGAFTPEALLELWAAEYADVGTLEARQAVEVGGRPAARLQVSGRGDGAKLSGQGSIPTTQLLVGIPRGEHTLVLVLSAPQAEFGSHLVAFERMLGSVRLVEATRD